MMRMRMVRVSVLNGAIKSMYNAEKWGKRQVMIIPSSKVIIKFLLVMQKHGYIGEYEWVDDHRAGKIVVELNGRLNKCGVISPHFYVGVKEIESWTARLLPSRSLKPLETEKAKKRTFKRRMLGLKKKISEFSILCDVDACFICFEDNSSPLKTEIWPENSSELERIISRYAKLEKEGHKCRHFDLPSASSEAEKGSKKKRKRSKEEPSYSYPTWDDGLNGLSEASLKDLARALESKIAKIDSVKERIQVCAKQKQSTLNCHSVFPTIPLDSENVGTAVPAVSEVGLAGTETRHLPMFPDLNFGIESYRNVGTAGPAASEVSDTRNLLIDFGILSNGNVGTADPVASDIGLAGPETRNLPMFPDLDLGIKSYGNMSTSGPAMREFGAANRETRLLPEATDCGIQNFYGDVATSDQPTSNICLGVATSNENLWMEGDQMANSAGMDIYLEKQGMGSFNSNEMGTVFDQPCFTDSAVVNSLSYCSEDYLPQMQFSPLPVPPCNCSFCNSTAVTPCYSGFQKYL